MGLSKEVEFEFFKLMLHENLYYEVLVYEDSEFTSNDLKKLVSVQQDIGGLILPALIVCAESANTNTDLLKALSKNVNNPYSTADAFVISSLSQKIFANFYLKIFKPERPTKFFNNKDEAFNWLKQYIYK